MHLLSIPALLVALVASFSPAILFSIVHPTPGLQQPVPQVVPQCTEVSRFDFRGMLDAVEGPIHNRGRHLFPSKFLAASTPKSYTPVVDASNYLGTTFDRGYKPSCLLDSMASCAPSSAVYPAWSLIIVTSVVLVLYALHVFGLTIAQHLWPHLLDVRRAVRRRVLHAVLNPTVVLYCLCRLVFVVDEAIGRAFVRALLSAAVLARWLWWLLQHAAILAVDNWPVMADRSGRLFLAVKRAVLLAILNAPIIAERLWWLVLAVKRTAVLAVGIAPLVAATLWRVIVTVNRAVVLLAPVLARGLWHLVLAVDRAIESAVIAAPIIAERLLRGVLAIGEVTKRTGVDHYTAEEPEAECIPTCVCRPPTAYRTSSRVRPCSAPGHLILVPTAPTPAGAAVWRIVCLPPPAIPVPPVAHQRPCVRVYRSDRSRVITDIPTRASRKSDRIRTHSTPGNLALDPVVSIPTGAAVIPVAPPTPIFSHVAPVEVKLAASPRVCRPDRQRVITDIPATPVRTSTRERTLSAPGQLLLVPAAPTPAGAAVRRLIPLSPLRTVARTPRLLPAPPLAQAAQYIPTAPRDVPGTILYETPTVARSSIIYQTSAGAPSSSVIYSTGPAPLVAQRAPHLSSRSPRPSRASTIVYHARSGPPAFQQAPALAPYDHLVRYQIARVEAEANRREALQHYRAQHCPGALGQRVRAATTQGRAAGARRPPLTSSPSPRPSDPIHIRRATDRVRHTAIKTNNQPHHHIPPLSTSASPGSAGQTCLAGLGAWTRAPESESQTCGFGSRRARA
ncbi:hypothetical protein FB451DRAFT_1549154 [Mycena latifolia]|nr:hypothetical protein FB451DRAFT_1549154 [Mycena latifolia]